MRRVFIVNDQGYNYGYASRWGQLVNLTSGRINKHRLSDLQVQVEAIFGDCDPEDYILPSGPSLLTALVCSIFAAKHKRLNLLLYHPTGENAGKYSLRQFTFGEKSDDTGSPAAVEDRQQ